MNITSTEPLFQYVSPDNLTEHPEAHRIPRMSIEEWADFSASVTERGEITDPVFAMRNGKVFDGRHRLQAAQESGIKLIPALFYEISEDEALNRMRQSATERRSLSPGQKVMINLEFDELLEQLRSVAKERQIEAGKFGVEGGRGNIRETLSAGLQQGLCKEGGVADHIAQMSGTSARNVYKAQAVIREAPDLAERVKSGEITINKAESELKKRKLPPQGTATDATPPEPKIERLRTRKKPPELAVRPDESAISANNRTIKYTKEQLTPFIEGFLMQYYTASRADDEARAPFIEETRVLFEACFRMLIEFSGDKLFETMEEIRNGNETEDET